MNNSFNKDEKAVAECENGKSKMQMSIKNRSPFSNLKMGFCVIGCRRRNRTSKEQLAIVQKY
jgi:hypothetical protein